MTALAIVLVALLWSATTFYSVNRIHDLALKIQAIYDPTQAPVAVQPQETPGVDPETGLYEPVHPDDAEIREFEAFERLIKSQIVGPDDMGARRFSK